jgi:metal-responsive CopG/Arc/MetJ family transcriptional regulator
MLMGRSVKINITLPGDELTRIDRHVQEEKTTRSGLILKSLKSYIERKEEEVAEKKRLSAIRQAASDIKKLRAKSGRWNGVAEIRKWRDAR